MNTFVGKIKVRFPKRKDRDAEKVNRLFREGLEYELDKRAKK